MYRNLDENCISHPTIIVYTKPSGFQLGLSLKVFRAVLKSWASSDSNLLAPARFFLFPWNFFLPLGLIRKPCSSPFKSLLWQLTIRPITQTSSCASVNILTVEIPFHIISSRDHAGFCFQPHADIIEKHFPWTIEHSFIVLLLPLYHSCISPIKCFGKDPALIQAVSLLKITLEPLFSSHFMQEEPPAG